MIFELINKPKTVIVQRNSSVDLMFNSVHYPYKITCRLDIDSALHVSSPGGIGESVFL